MKKNKINLKVIIIFVTYFFLNILAYILFFNFILKKLGDILDNKKIIIE